MKLINSWLLIFLSLFVLFLLFVSFAFADLSVEEKEKEDKYTELRIPSNMMKKRVVISMTTSPSRIFLLKPVIDSIKRQSFKVDKFYLNVPYIFKRTEEEYVIPVYINEDPFISVIRCEDLGPATKLIPILKEELDPETLIITIDDDTLYPSEFVKTFLFFSVVYPKSVLTGSSYMPITNIFNDEKYETKKVELLEGFSGVLYKRYFLDKIGDEIDFTNLPRCCFLSDDFIFSNYILKKGYTIRLISPKYHKVKQLNYGFEQDALHKLSIEDADKADKELHNFDINNAKYIQCSNYLQDKNNLFIRYYMK